MVLVEYLMLSEQERGTPASLPKLLAVAQGVNKSLSGVFSAGASKWLVDLRLFRFPWALSLPLKPFDLHEAGKYCRVGPVPHSWRKIGSVFISRK